MIDKAEALFRRAFSQPRTRRSDAYKAGVLSALKYRFDGIAINCPNRVGTAEADAFFSGLGEGHRIFREHEGSCCQ